MPGKIAGSLCCLTLAVTAGTAVNSGRVLAAPAQLQPAAEQTAETKPAVEPAKPADDAAPKKEQDGKEKAPRGPGDQGPGGPQGPRRIFGEVTAVRGNVLQMRTEESEGLTRVILAADAQIIRDDKLKPDALKPGTKVMGMGRPVEGTGTASVPLKVEVQMLNVEGGMGGPFMFGFGGRGGPLLRGRRSAVFRKQNYSGSIEFNALVKSVSPLVLVDDQGNPLPVIVGDDLEVHQRSPRPIKEGDITAGARLMAMGETTPDGLLNAHMIFLFGGGDARGSVPGTIIELNDKGLKVRPRFEPRDIQIQIDPAVKVYFQENLDLDSIHVGDTLSFTGKVVGGDAKAPKTLVVRTITPVDSETPNIDEGGGGPFGGGVTVKATVKGKIIAFEPLRVQTEDGREVTIKVPGQVAYARYRPLERSALKAGQKALIAGQFKEGGPVADVIIVNPSLAMGPGF